MQDLAFGARAAHALLATPPPPRRNWAAQRHLARVVGKRFQGCRVKRLYVNNQGSTCIILCLSVSVISSAFIQFRQCFPSFA